MRIAIICGAGMISGKEIMALELARGLREAGEHVECATSFWGSREFRQSLQALQIPIHVLRLGFISASLTPDAIRMTVHQGLHWPGLLVAYHRFLHSARPEKVIHTNWHHLLLLWPLLDPKRDLFWLHEIVPDKPQYRRVFRRLDRKLQFFLPVSHAVGRSLHKFGIAETKIRAIHNGTASPVSERRLGRSSNSLVVGIVGQVGVWKGHEDLFEAFAAIAPKNPGAELHVFGQGSTDYEQLLKDRAVSLGIASKVFWRGFISDRFLIYREIDVCVVPSRFQEPLGMVAIEAGFAGIPVIASRMGGLPEIVQDGVTGFLVAASQPKAMASKLELLLRDEALRRRMGAEARVRVTANFGHARFIEEFRGVLGMT